MKAEAFISTRIFQYYRFITLDIWLGLFDIFMLELQGRLGFNFKFKTLREELPYKKDGGVRPQTRILLALSFHTGDPPFPRLGLLSLNLGAFSSCLHDI